MPGERRSTQGFSVSDNSSTSWDSEYVPSHIGEYRVIRKVSSGGMGEVYEAVKENLDERTVAAKVLKDAFPSEAQIKQFLLESAALSRLSHPNIVTVHDAGTYQTPFGLRPYIVTERITNSITLSDSNYLNKTPFNARLKIVLQVCDAISHAHEKQVIHGDIKPGNVLGTVRKPFKAKVIDFGLTRLLYGPGQAQPGYTPGFDAPEFIMRGRTNPDYKTDQYALGVTARLVLLRNGNAPNELRKIIDRACSNEPEDRYQTVAEFRDELAKFRDELAKFQANLHRRILRAVTEWFKPRPRRAAIVSAVLATLIAYLVLSPVIFRYTSAGGVFEKLIAPAVAKTRTLENVRLLVVRSDQDRSSAKATLGLPEGSSNRLLHAGMMSTLAAAKPRVVALDFFLMGEGAQEDRDALLAATKECDSRGVPVVAAVPNWLVPFEGDKESPVLGKDPNVRLGVCTAPDNQLSAALVPVSVARGSADPRPGFALQVVGAWRRPTHTMELRFDRLNNELQMQYRTGRNQSTDVHAKVPVSMLARADEPFEEVGILKDDLVAYISFPPPDLKSILDESTSAMTRGYSEFLAMSPAEQATWSAGKVVMLADVTKDGIVKVAGIDTPGCVLHAAACDHLIARKELLSVGLMGRLSLTFVSGVLGVLTLIFFCSYLDRFKSRSSRLAAMTMLSLMLVVVVVGVCAIISMATDTFCHPVVPTLAALLGFVFAAWFVHVPLKNANIGRDVVSRGVLGEGDAITASMPAQAG